MQEEPQNQPGQVVQPNTNASEAVQEAPVVAPEQVISENTPKEPQDIPKAASDEKPAWQFHEDGNSDTTTSSSIPETSIQPVTWTASEFIEHDKKAGWYGLLVLFTVIAVAIVYLLTRDEVTAGIIILVAIVFGIFASRKPRELQYGVDTDGIHIGEKDYPYATFKSFAVVQEGGIESIWLMPLKRFMPILTIYFDPKDGEKITEVIGNYLPVQNHEMDAVDKLMHRIRF